MVTLTDADNIHLIDEDKVPVKIKKKRQEWIRLLHQVPRGKAWVIDEKVTGLKAGNVKAMVSRLVREGDVPDTFKVVQRTRGNTTTIFVINSAKVEEVKK